MSRRVYIAMVLIVAVAAAIGVYYHLYGPKATVYLYVSTTTSLYQTGLLDYLANIFHSMYPEVNLTFFAVGSGEALARAARGDACVALVHAPSLEVNYINNKTLYNHIIFAFNYFIVVGPPNDPANVSRAVNAVDAFKRIYVAAEKGLTVFISRSDKSGTNVKELQLWKLAQVNPSGKSWYKECGCGMSEALMMTNNMNGYTLSDISTFLDLNSKGRIPNLRILFQNSTELINIYSGYISSKCSGTQLDYAKKFLEFLSSDRGQEAIAKYGVDRFGAPLFNPAKGQERYLLDTWNTLSKG